MAPFGNSAPSPAQAPQYRAWTWLGDGLRKGDQIRTPTGVKTVAGIDLDADVVTYGDGSEEKLVRGDTYFSPV